VTGMVGGFGQMKALANVVLANYTGEVPDFIAMLFTELVDQVAKDTLPVQIRKVFYIDQIVEAHLYNGDKPGRRKDSCAYQLW
jgi:hypothetical protein